MANQNHLVSDCFLLISIYEFLKWYFKLLEKGINWIADQLIKVINKIILILEAIGRFLKRVFGKLYDWIKNIVTWLWNILKFLFKPFYRIIEFIGRWIYRLLCWIYNYISVFVRWRCGTGMNTNIKALKNYSLPSMNILSTTTQQES
jgi:phage-related protein